MMQNWILLETRKSCTRMSLHWYEQDVASSHVTSSMIAHRGQLVTRLKVKELFFVHKVVKWIYEVTIQGQESEGPQVISHFGPK